MECNDSGDGWSPVNVARELAVADCPTPPAVVAPLHSAASSTAALDTLSRFIGTPALHEIAVDPRGRYVALISRHADLDSDVFLNRLNLLDIGASGALTTRWVQPRPDAHMLRFAPATGDLAFLEGDGGRGVRAVVIASGTGESRIVAEALGSPAQLTWATSGHGLFVASTVAPDDDAVLVATTIPERLPWAHSSTQLRYIPLDPEATGEAVLLCHAPGEVEHLAVSPDGRWLLFTESACTDGCCREHRLRRLDLSGLREPPGLTLPTPVVSSLVMSPSGRRLAYIGGRRPWLDGGRSPGPCHQPASPGHQVNGYDTRVCVVDLQTERAWLLSGGAHLAAGIPVGLAPTHQEIQWHGDDRLTFVATQGSHTVMATQSIYDDGTLTIAAVGRGSSRSHCFADDEAWFLLHSEEGKEFEVARWTHRDGVSPLRCDLIGLSRPRRRSQAPILIEDAPVPAAWLWRPRPEAAASPCPLIVDVYGGAAPLALAYNETQQAFAASGYAVLVINPSGCAGYGREVADRHVHDWGDRATAEIIATTQMVLGRYSDLDASRVGIYGGSYGGFIVMRTLVATDLFAAGVSLAGFSNVVSYLAGSRTGYEYGVTAAGNVLPWSEPESFTTRSPLFQATRIRSPLLLVHGECDSVVPLEESQQMFVALKSLGRPVALVVIPNEDHPMASRPSARLVHQRYLLAWFAKTLRLERGEWDSLAQGPCLGARSVDRMRADASRLAASGDYWYQAGRPPALVDVASQDPRPSESPRHDLPLHQQR